MLKTNENGAVEFLLISGKDKVAGTMTEAEAAELIRKGETKKSGNNIIVNNKFIFTTDDEEEVIKTEVKKPLAPKGKKLVAEKKKRK